MNADPTLLEVLREVIDPELGVDIVNLGLVYGTYREGIAAKVVMTMTSPACPLGEVITEEVKRTLREQVPGLLNIEVELVFDPPWTPARMTEDARSQLGWGGQR